MNSILSTRCPGRRLTNEITHEWSEVKQEEKIHIIMEHKIIL